MAVVGGCSGATELATPNNASPTANADVPEASESPAAIESAGATDEPTANAETPPPTPAPSAEAGVTREYVKACTSYSYVHLTIIVTIKNTGTTWVKLVPYESDYTVYDKSENVVTTGSFSYAYPTYLAPGQTGYLADEGVADNVKAKNVKRVESDGYYEEVDKDEVIVLKTAKTKVKVESYSNELYATGTVTNTSSEKVESAHVGAFFMNSKGVPIEFSYTNLVENLGAGKTKGYKTIGTSCPLKKSQVSKTVVLAGDSY
jgi:hypothetical protein